MIFYVVSMAADRGRVLLDYSQPDLSCTSNLCATVCVCTSVCVWLLLCCSAGNTNQLDTDVTVIAPEPQATAGRPETHPHQWPSLSLLRYIHRRAHTQADTPPTQCPFCLPVLCSSQWVRAYQLGHNDSPPVWVSSFLHPVLSLSFT